MRKPSTPSGLENLPSTDERTTVFGFKKNARETVLASLSQFNGAVYLDIRAFAAGKNDELVATRKGLTISPTLIGELEEAVRRLRAAAEEAGLV